LEEKAILDQSALTFIKNKDGRFPLRISSELWISFDQMHPHRLSFMVAILY
jgi:hypothetical protein